MEWTCQSPSDAGPGETQKNTHTVTKHKVGYDSGIHAWHRLSSIRLSSIRLSRLQSVLGRCAVVPYSVCSLFKLVRFGCFAFSSLIVFYVASHYRFGYGSVTGNAYSGLFSYLDYFSWGCGTTTILINCRDALIVPPGLYWKNHQLI